MRCPAVTNANFANMFSEGKGHLWCMSPAFVSNHNSIHKSTYSFIFENLLNSQQVYDSCYLKYLIYLFLHLFIFYVFGGVIWWLYREAHVKILPWRSENDSQEPTLLFQYMGFRLEHRSSACKENIPTTDTPMIQNSLYPEFILWSRIHYTCWEFLLLSINTKALIFKYTWMLTTVLRVNFIKPKLQHYKC